MILKINSTRGHTGSLLVCTMREPINVGAQRLVIIISRTERLTWLITEWPVLSYQSCAFDQC